jgi:tripartite-type tricarboxylate transporter receptor subunit TctC
MERSMAHLRRCLSAVRARQMSPDLPTLVHRESDSHHGIRSGASSPADEHAQQPPNPAQLRSLLRQTSHSDEAAGSISGATGALGTSYAAKAAPDGYTLLMGAISSHSIGPLLRREKAFDAAADFEPISMAAHTPLVLCAGPALAVQSVQQLVEAARARPGTVSYGSAGTGSSLHLAGALFEKLAAVSLLHVPYKGAGPAAVDLAAGVLHVMFDTLQSALPLIRAGRLRPLGVCGRQRTALLPAVPTIHEQGLAGYEISGWLALFAPARTPTSIVRALHEHMFALAQQRSLRESLLEQGSELTASTPAELRSFLEAESIKWTALVEQLKLPKE